MKSERISPFWVGGYHPFSAFKNVVDGFKSVWVDKKTFNRYYWGFIGLLETTVCALSLVLYYWVKFGAP